jgi:hypothetical protein
MDLAVRENFAFPSDKYINKKLVAVTQKIVTPAVA